MEFPSSRGHSLSTVDPGKRENSGLQFLSLFEVIPYQLFLSTCIWIHWIRVSIPLRGHSLSTWRMPREMQLQKKFLSLFEVIPYQLQNESNYTIFCNSVSIPLRGHSLSTRPPKSQSSPPSFLSLFEVIPYQRSTELTASVSSCFYPSSRSFLINLGGLHCWGDRVWFLSLFEVIPYQQLGDKGGPWGYKVSIPLRGHSLSTSRQHEVSAVVFLSLFEVIPYQQNGLAENHSPDMLFLSLFEVIPYQRWRFFWTTADLWRFYPSSRSFLINFFSGLIGGGGGFI